MKFPVRLLLAASLILLVAACKRDTKPDDVVQPPVDNTPPAQVDTDRIDPRDYTDPRNLDNPESLLSRRVIYFDFDRSVIRPEFRDVLSAHAAYASANRSARIVLESHADERGSREYNLGLGERRGNSVESALGAGGSAGNQMEVVSYGEERPTCNQSSETCWQNNRRVEIVYTAR